MPATAMPSQRLNGIHLQEGFSPPKNTPIEGGVDSQSALHAQYVLQLLQLQRKAGFLCDITIHVKDRSFKAHKPLLAACSLYFRGLFADVDSKESAALSLTSLTPSGFQVLLDYIYSGSLAITAENSSEVLSAAICLQMTNVVETCLSFMRSSFRISKINEPPLHSLKKNCSEYPTAPTTPDHGTERHTSKYKASLETSNNKDHLQIISAQSIKEAEFKSMIVDAFNGPSNRKPPATTGASTEQFVENNHLPNISQLHSVFLNHTADHPPPKATSELQQMPGSIKNAMSSSSAPAGRKFHHSVPTTNASSAVYSRSYHKSPHAYFSQPSHRKAMVPTSSTGGISIKPSAMNHSHQISLLTSPISTTNSKANSVKDVTTTYSAAHSQTTPEQNSGIAQTGMVLSGVNEKEAVLLRQRRESLLEQYFSDEQGNKVEISSEEDGECNAWSADRSVLSSSDLSVTPSVAVAQIEPSRYLKEQSFSAAPLAISNCVDKVFETNTRNHKNLVSKASSLPSLSPKLPIGVPRAHSSEERLTHEVARGEFASGPAGCARISFNPMEASRKTSQDKICETSTIVTQALHKNLLPSKTNETDGFSKHTSPHQLHPESYGSSSDGEFGKHIKVEADDDSGEGVRGFCIANDSHVHHAPSLHAVEEDSDSEKSRYLLKEHNDAASDEKYDDTALDLSIPQHGARRRSSSIQSNDPPLHISSVHDSDSDAIDRCFFPCHSSSASSVADPGVHVAVEPLSMLRQSNHSPAKQAWIQSSTEQPSDLYSESNSQSSLPQEQPPHSRSSLLSDGPPPLKRSEATFSRKPRRTNGGQTCTWPGCGRLIRHRNMFEEHLRQHELGTPVSQLRKCYTGARVKKTVREQLEELRTNDSVFEGASDCETVRHGRVGKRKSTSDSQEPFRKRVSVKDSLPVATSPHAPTRPFVQHPSLRAHQSLSHPPLVNGQTPVFRHPSVPGSGFPGSLLVQGFDAAGIVKLAQTAETNKTLLSTHGGAIGQPAIVGSTAPPLASAASTMVYSVQSPVEATLTFLGIPTPPCGNPARGQPKNFPVPTSSTEQIRRRLAIRETTDAGSVPAHGMTDLRVLVNPTGTLTRVNPISSRGTAAHPGVFALTDRYTTATSSGGTNPPRRLSHNLGPTSSG